MMLEGLVASSILLASAPQPADRPTWCQPDRVVNVRVGLIAPRPTSDFSKTTTQLEQFQIDTKSPYGAHIDTHVGGLTAGTIKVEQKMNIGGARLGQQSCLWPEDVRVTIRLEQKVYVAKDYAPGSCMHNAVWEHEHKHVRVDREIINEYRPRFERAIKTALAGNTVMGPVASRDEPKAQNYLMAKLQDAVARITHQMETDRNARQQAIDSREEYDRVANLCRGVR
jgi:hypothetical protein